MSRQRISCDRCKRELCLTHRKCFLCEKPLCVKCSIWKGVCLDCEAKVAEFGLMQTAKKMEAESK